MGVQDLYTFLFGNMERNLGLSKSNPFLKLAKILSRRLPCVFICELTCERHGGNMNRKELRLDRHTVSLLTDHLVFSPKYRGKMLVGDVAMICEGIICKTCVEMDIQKGSSSRILRKEFPHLREWCDEHFWAPSCFHGSVGNGWDVVEKYIREQDKYEYNREK